ncbi:CAF17-like 4Fe-4S cluster assembly/insertion protein YgfZ [Brevundimonas sp.]
MTQIARLDSRALIRVSGPDARPFLHNLLTQDVETLAEGALRFGALLSPPGRLLFDLFLWGTDDGVVLDVAADRRDALIQRLSMYRLRSNVQIAALDEPVFAAWDGEAAVFVADPRLAALGDRAWGLDVEATTSEDDYRAHGLRHGVPDPALDTVQDKTWPIEANFDLLNGIDFHKGCFIGQETASRMHRRGTIKNRMMGLTFDGPPPAFGAEVLNGSLRAGEVMGGHDGAAIALLRIDRLEGSLSVDGRSVVAHWPDYLLRDAG